MGTRSPQRMIALYAILALDSLYECCRYCCYYYIQKSAPVSQCLYSRIQRWICISMMTVSRYLLSQINHITTHCLVSASYIIASTQVYTSCGSLSLGGHPPHTGHYSLINRTTLQIPHLSKPLPSQFHVATSSI